MYLTSKNGHFGAIIYSLENVIKYHKEGYIVYNPIFTEYGSLTIPRQSKMNKMLQNGEINPMEFRDGIPYWNDKPLLKTNSDNFE